MLYFNSMILESYVDQIILPMLMDWIKKLTILCPLAFDAFV